MMVTKLYCYVDETGQDTKGELFLVAVVLKEITGLEALEKKLEEIEIRTGKKQSRWKKTSRDIKKKYLEELIQVKELKNAIFYATYQASKEYSKLTSFTIAKAVLAKETTNYTVTVIIDGLNKKTRLSRPGNPELLSGWLALFPFGTATIRTFSSIYTIPFLYVFVKAQNVKTTPC